MKALRGNCKFLFTLFLAGCSINPATGDRQFTALMSPAQEVQIGAQEHEKILKTFGVYKDEPLNSYVRGIGQKVTQKTERPEVAYKFYVLDTPTVNAFALPGGYIYITRGLLALSNNEAELAAVLAHETGHITARHSAERYSHSVVSSLGTTLLGVLVDVPGIGQAADLGSDLYIKSYSRSQESQADSLGLRYLSQAGYDTRAMVEFLRNLQAHSALEDVMNGRTNASGASYFSTHPATGERIAKTAGEAASYPPHSKTEKEVYLNAIDGIIYGDSGTQGFIRGQKFLHPALGFTFSVPEGFRLMNRPAEVIATDESGALILFDMVSNPEGLDSLSYLTQRWMKDQKLEDVERINVNGANAATAAFSAQIDGRPMNVRLLSIPFGTSLARFQIGIPLGTQSPLIDKLKKATYSFRALTPQEQKELAPNRIHIVTARAGDTAARLSAPQPLEKLSLETFRVLNGLAPREELIPGRRYKIITPQ